jgi:hypothetical protein
LKSCKLEMPFVTPCTPDISPRTIPSDCIPGEEDRLQPPSNKMHTIGVRLVPDHHARLHADIRSPPSPDPSPAPTFLHLSKLHWILPMRL